MRFPTDEQCAASQDEELVSLQRWVKGQVAKYRYGQGSTRHPEKVRRLVDAGFDFEKWYANPGRFRGKRRGGKKKAAADVADGAAADDGGGGDGATVDEKVGGIIDGGSGIDDTAVPGGGSVAMGTEVPVPDSNLPAAASGELTIPV